ncbi:MAG: 2-C-methyl-D-erythritol 4-phosphate cytidylyltransferase [Thermoleophilia bacterium]|nr:2-C-methyl-D-erythritol 4-phosphate cytidylyltransferase [Thermoleophilia bacterium]
MTPDVTALIVAAGSGLRLGSDGPKALVDLAGRPLFEWSLDACRRAARIGPIVIAVPPGREHDFEGDGRILTAGGATRALSVSAGLEAVETGIVLIHDAARPLVTSALIDASIAALEDSPELDAVIAAAPVTDTVKRVGRCGRIEETLDRSELRAAQTPQVCRTAALRRAIRSGSHEGATDDASLIESDGGSVGVVDGPPENIKVTVPSDLALAGFLLGRAVESATAAEPRAVEIDH